MKDAGESEGQGARSQVEKGSAPDKPGFVSTTCGSGWARRDGEEGSVPNKSPIRSPPSKIPLVYAPVEYKKGKRRKWDNDNVQLCAQAFCLEEMFSVTVPEGFIYHAGSKRRRKVSFDESLRLETQRTIEAVRALIANSEDYGRPTA